MGVLIAVSNDLISSEATELDKLVNFLGSYKFDKKLNNKIFTLRRFLQTTSKRFRPLFQLDASLSRITHTTDGYVWRGGDFNARFVDWTSLEESPTAGSERPQNKRGPTATEIGLSL